VDDGEDAARGATRRREAAAARARELHERQEQLRAGEPVTAADVVRARVAADSARERARVAARAAILRHEDAAVAHEAAAHTVELAARLDPAHAGELQERATRHRAAAARSRADALLDAAEPTLKPTPDPAPPAGG
jgi:hypothetical protein